MVLKVKNLIKNKPVTVDPNTPTRDVVKLMAKYNIGSVIIIEGEKPVGIFTERDLVKTVSENRDLNLPVKNNGTYRNLIVVNENDSIKVAAELMKKYNIRHLPVVNNDGKLVGVISIRDLIYEDHVLDMLKSIEEEGGSD
jgi:CBS domain-containing protein